MSISNLRNVHLGEAQVAAVNAAIAQLETELAAISVNLTAEERRRYGSINEQNKLFVNRVHDFHTNQPGQQAPQVNWEEFDKDYESRRHLGSFIDRLEAILQNLKNARTLHDYDNYQDALNDYAYTNYMAGTAAAGYEAKQSELAQFFASRANKAPEASGNTRG